MKSSELKVIATDIAGYFRDFLESDFKRVQAPSRRIVLNSDRGFRTGMRVKPYDGLNHELWKLIKQPSGEAMEMKIAPRRYTRKLSEIIKKILHEQIAIIEESQILQIRTALKEKINQTYKNSYKDPEEWIEKSIEFLHNEISQEIIKPLVARIEGPLKKQAYNIIDTLIEAEKELASLIAAELSEKLPNILAKYLAIQNDQELTTVLNTFLTLTNTQVVLERFFENYISADAFLEFRDLENFVSITESVNLYLYLGTIRYGNITYPLFFLPVEVNKIPDGKGFQVTIINQLFVNRYAIDFVQQELSESQKRTWVSVVTDRIIYLKPEQSVFEIVDSLFRKIANSVDLAGEAIFELEAEEAKNSDVTLSSELYFCAYEKGAEALVNDYEEIISLSKQGDSQIVNLFEEMINSILEENPKSIRRQIDSEWEALTMVDRMVFDSPIPLNEEQRKILFATQHSEGRIIVVEGPPGTGKSHTITAIAADCAFNKKSCLILSDKSEALEVVHNKLSEAMSRVRHDRNFPNPILRLGRQDANFKKLVGNQTLNQVIAFTKAMNANEKHIDKERYETANYLRESITKTIDTYEKIDLVKVRALHILENEIQEVSKDLVEEFHLIHEESDFCQGLERLLAHGDLLSSYLVSLPKDSVSDISWLEHRASIDLIAGDFIEKNPESVEIMNKFEGLNTEQIKELSLVILQYKQLRMPIIGYLFNGSAVRELEAKVNALPTTRPLMLKNESNNIEKIIEYSNKLKKDLENHSKSEYLYQAYSLVTSGIKKNVSAKCTLSIISLFGKYKSLLNKFLNNGAEHFVQILLYINESNKLRIQFESIPDFDYVGLKDKLDRINTSRMNAHIDSRLLNFMENYRADARTMAKLISQRQKFPEEKFEAVRSSFPVIISGIREFGEFMPLLPELFDIVVIDEASQVSVAQALPAILRAKKVVVLGDSRQFANVKSANSSIATNEKYRSNLVNFFESNISKDPATLQRLSMFDVKKSILEFCSLTSSYTTMLRKHFRSYPELIGYSSKTFYDGQLQAIKIRSKPIEDVIRFNLVNTEKLAVTRTTNYAEVDFITKKLVELIKMDIPPTVGIITPFREQHALLTKFLFAHELSESFEKILKLKVMTFDSCQGEERQLIFYSMVATEGNDALSYIFPAALEINDSEAEEKLKVQRLNVGFSRAQECVWIVHSMPLGMFKGSISKTLNYYSGALNSKLTPSENKEQPSLIESKILNWLNETDVVKSNIENFEIIPKFLISDYLRQLDPTYEHPKYKSNLLIIYKSVNSLIQIIIEYDGWENYFIKGSNEYIGNHHKYMKDLDIERQLILESYGYRFIRINRFTLGRYPILSLNEKLKNIIATANMKQESTFVDILRKHAEGIVNKDMIQCIKCDSIKPKEKFFDPNLKSGIGGVGKICLECKAIDTKPNRSNHK